MTVYKLLREFKGLTQTELAEVLNISIACVSLIESGKRVPSASLRAKISEVFGISEVVLRQGVRLEMGLSGG